MNPTDPTSRFSDRAQAYAAYRPDYPAEAITWMMRSLGNPAVVADVGAGTGISTRALRRHGARVIAVEPNDAMRDAGREELGDIDDVEWVAGTAEATGLSDESVDAVVAAQSFHWFDHRQTRAEWRRISRPPHRVGLVWNHRMADFDDFTRTYEDLLARYGTDYKQVNHQRAESRTESFFPGTTARATFPNVQKVGWEAFRGRTMSSSYVPQPGHPDHAPLFDKLRELFDEHAVDGLVAIRYAVIIFVGTI
jgi:ubiquinone/menaquinone biosynthesis C-methylase UbiE